jgi:hypothetical protein
MSIKNYSRRKFLGNIAAGSTAAALSSLPGGQAARADTDAVTPPYPVTLATHPGPLYSPTSSPPLENIKIVSTDYIPQADVEKIQSYSPTLKLVQCRSHEQFHREVVDAHVIFGVFRPEDFQVAKQLRWIQWRPAGCFYPCQNQEFVESPVVLTNNKRTYAVGISETAIGLLLALAHGLNKYAVQTEKHIWRSLSEPYLRALREYTSGNRNQPFTMVDELREINGITMGLVGFGVSERLSPIGLTMDLACGFWLWILNHCPFPPAFLKVSPPLLKSFASWTFCRRWLGGWTCSSVRRRIPK